MSPPAAIRVLFLPKPARSGIATQSEMIATSFLLILCVCVVGFLAVGIGWAVSVYNNLVTLRNRVDNTWAQIDVQLKRRYDLIPNLVETVKGYAKHERETFENVTRARA